MPDFSDRLTFDLQPDLVLQDDGINAVSTLHAAKGLDVRFAAGKRVVVPLVHEQTRATSAGSRVQLPACGKGANGIFISVLYHHSAARWFF